MTMTLLDPCRIVRPGQDYRVHLDEGVARHQWYPGDGYSYVCYVSRLPIDADGGHRDSHALVTLITPTVGAYVLGTEGTLVGRYVVEKFPALDRLSDPMRDECIRLIATALHRPAYSS